MTRILLLKYGEIVLKGLNRGYFNMLLERRVKQLLAPITQPGGSFSIEYMQSTMYVRAHGNADISLALERLKKVFGVVAICPSFETEKNIDSICSAAAECMDELIGNAKTFKCTARRSDKSFPLTSPEICDFVGGTLLDARPSLKVDVHDPEVTVTVEIRDKAAYIHGAPVKGAGGMPNGSNGRAMLLLSGGIDSPVAGYLAAKRGVAIDCIYFESPPYTSEMAREKVISLARRLYLYASNIYLHCVPATHIQEL
ncbi:MAG TPA: THUMP domain-containing protein, partial [Bacillota bacterium]|nr:THUMP domain-containing protein [Bacillota bacterium]